MSSLVVVFILFLSLSISSCEGRHLRSNMKDFSTPFPHSTKHDAKMQHDRESLDSVKRIETSSSKGAETDEVQVGATIEGPEGSEERHGAVDGGRKAVSGAVRTSSVVRVSRRGHGEHPGFHVDYAGPRTHPPSHN